MERSSSRLKVFAVLVVIMFVALSTRLWFLQVLATEQSQEAAKNNRVREAFTDALRGEIITADQANKENPVPLVTNRKSLEVRINKQELDESGRADAVLLDLSDLLEIDVTDLTTALESTQYFEYQPKPVAEFVDEDVRFYIEEHQEDFPGVDVVDASVRSYPFGESAAHIVGTLNQIEGDEIKDPAFAEYGLNDLVGRSGLEAVYERWLRGEKGVERTVVNADGEAIRRLGGKAPTPGNNLILTMDSRIQQASEDALAEGIARAKTRFDDETNKYYQANAGAVVVLDAQTGGVVAMASYPTYDPRWFVRGLKSDEECYLGLGPTWLCGGADSVAPMLDRAYQEVYIPGSTFKPFTALAAVKEGFATLGGSYDCPPTYVHGVDETTEFTNWSSVGLGYMPISSLLKISCDTAFYKWGSDFYYRYINDQFGENNEPLQRSLRQWGFERPTGIDLPGEAEGIVPDRQWAEKDEQEAILPYGMSPGVDILLMIGSGHVKVSPLQLAQAYATLANGGHICTPHLVDHIESPRGRVVKTVNGHCDRTVPYTQTQLDYIMSALTQVPQVGGTAASAFLGFPMDQYPVAGKTGTAVRGGEFQDTSWFAGVVPANDPEYVVVAMVEQAGFGSEVAAPIVRRVIESIYGIESSAAIITQAGQD